MAHFRRELCRTPPQLPHWYLEAERTRAESGMGRAAPICAGVPRSFPDRRFKSGVRHRVTRGCGCTQCDNGYEGLAIQAPRAFRAPVVLRLREPGSRDTG